MNGRWPADRKGQAKTRRQQIANPNSPLPGDDDDAFPGATYHALACDKNDLGGSNTSRGGMATRAVTAWDIKPYLDMYYQIDSADCRGATPVKRASDANDQSAVDAQDAGATIVSLIRSLQDAVPAAFSVEQNASIGRSGRKADFVIRKQGGDVRAVGKVVSTRLMADSDGVESGIGDAQELVRMYHDESKSGSRVKKVVDGVVAWMADAGVLYGIITTGIQTWLVHRRAANRRVWAVEISGAVHEHGRWGAGTEAHTDSEADSEAARVDAEHGDTALAIALVFFVCKALTDDADPEREWRTDMGWRHIPPVTDGCALMQDNSRIHLVDSNPATCMCNRGQQLATAHVQDAVDAHRRSHQGAVPAQDEHGHERRHLTVRLHEELGKGQLATVRRGCYHGHQVAVKMVWLQDPHAAFDVHTALRNELGMYKALQAIQGDAVPMLYDVVKTSDMVCLVMQLGGQRVGVWGDEERRLARAALAKIHALGYLHGGVRRANVVFVGGGTAADGASASCGGRLGQGGGRGHGVDARRAMFVDLKVTAYVGVLDKAIFKAEMDAIAQL